MQPSPPSVRHHGNLANLIKERLAAQFRSLRPRLVSELSLSTPDLPTPLGRRRVNWHSANFDIVHKAPAPRVAALRETGETLRPVQARIRALAAQWNCRPVPEARYVDFRPLEAASFRVDARVTEGPRESRAGVAAALERRESARWHAGHAPWSKVAPAEISLPPLSVSEPAIETRRIHRSAQVSATVLLDATLYARHLPPENVIDKLARLIGVQPLTEIRLGPWSRFAPDPAQRAYAQTGTVEATGDAFRPLLRTLRFADAGSCTAAAAALPRGSAPNALKNLRYEALWRGADAP